MMMVSDNCGVGFCSDHFSLLIAGSPEVIGGTCKLKPSELGNVKNWVIFNKNVLIDYWNEEETSTLRLVNNLQYGLVNNLQYV